MGTARTTQQRRRREGLCVVCAIPARGTYCELHRQEELGVNEVVGWNVHYVPYRVTKITARRIYVIANHAMGKIFYLNRQVMERDGRQYHSRVHEYFFAEKPDHIGDYPPLNDRTVIVATEIVQ